MNEDIAALCEELGGKRGSKLMGTRMGTDQEELYADFVLSKPQSTAGAIFFFCFFLLNHT